jgi:hypothetical protein
MNGVFPFLSPMEVSRWICSYYNDEDAEIWGEENRALSVARVIGLDYRTLHGLERLAFGLLLEKSPPSSIVDKSCQCELTPTRVEYRSSVIQLRRDRRPFCLAVAWLCSPKRVSKSRRRTPGGGSGWFTEREPASRGYLRYFETHGLSHINQSLWTPSSRRTFHVTSTFRHWIDLFCAFLVNECRGTLPKEMPVKICRRCKRLFSVAESSGKARRRKAYCSTKCQQDGFWTPKRRAEDRFVRRFEDLSPVVLTERCKQPSVQERFQEIEKHWPPESKIVFRIQEIRIRAAKHFTNPS